MNLSSREKNRLKTNYGPWALVTGASSGIGREIALQLAEAGLNLVIHGRNEGALNALADELRGQNIQTEIVLADLANQQEIEKIIQASAIRDIGLFIASAGFGTSGSFLDASIDEEREMLRVNCEALLVLTHHFGRYFAARKKGGIILMSSLVAFQGVPLSANYAATKAYVQSLAEALAVELKPSGVDVLAAAPGPVESGFGKRAGLIMGLSLSPSQVAVPILRALGRQQTVLPGFLSKFLIYSLHTAPRWGRIRIMKLIMEGMTKHQRISVKIPDAARPG